jgi:N-acetyltransferase 10
VRSIAGGARRDDGLRLCAGFEALGFKEHLDYEAVQSTNPEFNKAIVRVNVFRAHRQTIQYVQPQDHFRLAQAGKGPRAGPPPRTRSRASDLLHSTELLVIDEAAAIPLPMVKKLLGPYMVFMSSTVNGCVRITRPSTHGADKRRSSPRSYEGTGRSLSLKLVSDLRRQSVSTPDAAGNARTLREITLEEPIRYAAGDPIEAWLNNLLCLDCK